MFHNNHSGNHNQQDHFEFRNPYVNNVEPQNYQSYPIPTDDQYMLAVAPQKAKKDKSSKLSRKAAALFLAFCLVASAGMGIGGGMLANQLSSHNSASTNTNTNANGIGLQQVGSTSSNGSQLTVQQIAEKAANSVVEITTEAVSTSTGMRQLISTGAGSGVIVDSNGYIVTNNHVIEGATSIKVTLKSGESYDATLVGTDAETDVAVLKINATGLQAAELGDSDTLSVGELAVAIGNPLGQLGGTVTDGIISALDREITLEDKTMTLLQTNAAINPGNSGGGLFNGQGQLIGLVVAKSSGENIEGLGFAIPVNKMKEVANQLMQYGYVKGRVQLGVSLLDITTEQQAMMYQVPRTGVYISQVTAGSAAQSAGLQAGDCIISVDGTGVNSASEVKAALQKHSVGDTVSLTILRNNQQLTVEATLQESQSTTTQDNSTTQDNDQNSYDKYFGGFGNQGYQSNGQSY